MNCIRILRCTVVLLLLSAVPSQAETAFVGIPSRQATAGPKKAEAQDVRNPSEALVVISRVDEKWQWTSREDRPLVKLRSGIYFLFIDPQGGGYIKMVNPEFSSLADEEYTYVEHLITGIGSISYWGKGRDVHSELLNLP